MELLTMVIATKNRHAYLERVMDYYAGSGISIIVADATKEKYQGNIPAGIAYQHFPELPYCVKLDTVFKEIKTPYAMLCADDDFIIPAGIKKSIDFLQENQDYHSAQGHYLFFYHSYNKLFYSPGYVSTQGCDINEESALARVDRFNHTAIQFYYCVHRTENLRSAFSLASGKLFNLNLVEALIGMIAIINGKHKVLPMFYSVRELLYNSAGRSAGLNVISVSPEFKQQYEVFFNAVSELISKTEGIESENSDAFLKIAIQKHIDFRYNNKKKSKKFSTLFKRILPLAVRKSIRHLALLNGKQAKFIAHICPQNPHAFQGSEEEADQKKIESLIFKYNIRQ